MLICGEVNSVLSVTPDTFVTVLKNNWTFVVTQTMLSIAFSIFKKLLHLCDRNSAVLFKYPTGLYCFLCKIGNVVTLYGRFRYCGLL